MAFLNVVAWIMMILAIIAYFFGTLTEESTGKRFANFLMLIGYIGTLIAYINK